MRHRSKIKMARATGLGALTACGLLLNPAGSAQGQSRVGNAGDTTRQASPGQAPGGRTGAGLGQDTQMLIAHGLEMAIEGSTLQALATHPGGMALGAPGVGAPRSVSAGDSTAVAGPGVATRVGIPGTSAPGLTGTAGSPSIIADRPVTPATEVPNAGVRTATPGSGIGRTAAGIGARPEGQGMAASMMSSPSASMLQQQAQHSFEDSDRLLAQAMRDGGGDQRLQQAATRYTGTLRTLGGRPGAMPAAANVGNGTGGSGTFPSATSATGLGGTGNPVTGPGGVSAATGASPAAGGAIGVPGGALAAPGGMAADADPASVAVINHGVKEAIGAMKIRQMVRMMGSSDSPAAQLLISHAREMDNQSRTTIQAISGGVGAAGGGPVQALAQQANEVILALQGIGG